MSQHCQAFHPRPQGASCVTRLVRQNGAVLPEWKFPVKSCNRLANEVMQLGDKRKDNLAKVDEIQSVRLTKGRQTL